MSNHNTAGNASGHHDDHALDAAFGWGSSNEWTWPTDLSDQHAQSPPHPAPSAPPTFVASRAPPIEPHYHRQLPPLSHSNPIASLAAALRGEDPIHPPLPSRRPASAAAPASQRQPHSSRHFPPRRGRVSSFGYIPDYLYYSPPESPEQSPSPQPQPQPQPERQPHTQSRTQPGPQVVNGAWQHPSYTPYRANIAQPGPSHPPATPQAVPFTTDDSPSTMPRASASSNRRKRSHSATAILVDDVGDSPPQAKRPRKKSPVQVDLSLDDDDEDEEDEEAPTAEEEALEKERQEQIKRQREESGRQVRINDLTCMICLERFTNLCVTHCGHIFCHECLTQALNASERNSERHIGSCPACRKAIKRGGSNKNQIIPLALMMKQQPTRKSAQEQKRGSRRPSKASISLDEA